MSPLERSIELELRTFRDRLAKEQGVEPYKIFHNETIDCIAREKPSTNLELLNIKGIGPAKAKHFGATILRIVQSAGEVKKEEGNQEQKIYSVGEFLDQFNTSFARKPLAIKGEIFDSIDRRGTNVYFKIKDETDEAVLSCYMRSSVEERSGISLEEGASIIISGYLGVYKPSGRFSLQVTEFILQGEGMLKFAFEELKRKLENEGMFREERKRTLSPYIRRIGLITAKGSDAEKDFCTHCGKYGISIERFDVRVEGLRSAEQVARAFEYFNSRGDDVDVIVLTRGGGSLESLQSFNSERVARAIFSSRIPVVCGVGHEKDISIADLVADIRASTPTHAGRIISEDWDLCDGRVKTVCSTLTLNAQTTISTCLTCCDGHCSRMTRVIDRIVIISNSRLGERLSHLTRSALYIFEKFGYIERMFNQNLGRLSGTLERLKRSSNESTKELLYKTDTIFQNLTYSLNSLEQRLSLASPEQRLKQGYSIALHNGKVLKSVEGLKKGDTINLEFFDGGAETKVESLNNSK